MTTPSCVPPDGALIAVLAALVPAHAAAQTCAVAGRPPSTAVTVRPRDGGRAFRVETREVPLIARFDRARGRVVPVDVDGPLRFTATMPPQVVTAGPVALAAGMLRLGGDLRVTWARTIGDRIIGAVADGRVAVDAVAIPCRDLRVGTPLAAGVPAAPAGDDGTAWYARSRVLVLHAAPGRGPTLRARIRDSVWVHPLRRLARRGRWARVVLETPSLVIVGWISRRLLRPPSERPVIRSVGTFGQGSGASSTHAYLPGNVFRGPALVAPGTTVFAAPSRGAWAVVRTGQPLTVEHRWGEPWVAILEAPSARYVRAGDGIEYDPIEVLYAPRVRPVGRHAWVLRGAVRFPHDAPRRGPTGLARRPSAVPPRPR